MNPGIDAFSKAILARNQTLAVIHEVRGFEIGLREFGTALQPLLTVNDNTSIPGIFWFAARYRFDNFVYEIGYGDRELIVEAKLYFPGFQNYSTHPTFLLQAIGKYRKHQNLFPKDFYEGLKVQVNADLDLLEEFSVDFSQVSESTIDAVQMILRKELLYDKEKQRRKDQTRDSEKAKLLFHEKKYREFLTTMKKYRDSADLDPSVKAMINYCDKMGG